MALDNKTESLKIENVSFFTSSILPFSDHGKTVAMTGKKCQKHKIYTSKQWKSEMHKSYYLKHKKQ